MKLRVDIRVLKAAVVILTAILILFAGPVLLRTWETKVGQAPTNTSLPDDGLYSDEQERDLTYFNGGWYAKRDGLETVLLLGLDKYEETTQNSYSNNQQSDFLLLLVLDQEKEYCTVLHLNRDTMTEIEILGVTGEPAGSFTGQLALAHTYGSGGTDSCENTAAAVSKLLYGVDIDHYISMTMDGVALLNDLAGGVTVEVLDDFTEIDAELVQGETVTLKGQQALTYVRARQALEDSSNLHRMERQRQYLSALQEQLSACVDQDAGFVFEALMLVNDYLVSDCTVEQLSNLSNKINSYDIGEYLTLEGEAVQGEEYMEFYVDEQALQTLVMDIFYELVEEA